MEHLLLVSGRASIGKTGTLNRLVKDLWKNPNFEFLIPPASWDDPLCVAGYYRGKIIGIITMGDPGREDFVIESLEKCQKCNCDIIIGATRTRGAVLNIYNKVASHKNLSPVTFTPINSDKAKNDSELADHLNKISSQSLFQFISNICQF